MSVYDRIAFHAKTNPWKLAMAGLGSFAETLSYGEFDLIVRRVAAYLHRNRVGADMRVGVICDDMFLQIIVSCALSHMGIEEIVQSDTGKLAGGAADVLGIDGPDLRRRLFGDIFPLRRPLTSLFAH